MLDLLELLGLKGITPSQNQPLQESVDMETQPSADASGLVTQEPLRVETPAAASAISPTTAATTAWEGNPGAHAEPALVAEQNAAAAVTESEADHPHSFSADWHAEPTPVLPTPTSEPTGAPELSPAPTPEPLASGFLKVDPNEPFEVGPKPYASSDTSIQLKPPVATNSPFTSAPEAIVTPIPEPTVAPAPTPEPTTVASPDIKYN